MDYVPLREARIFWDSKRTRAPGLPGEVAILGDGDRRRMSHLTNSGGACFGFWRECSADELYFRMLQAIWHLALEDISPEVIHRAFLVVPEYRASLPTDHPDYLGHMDEEAQPACEAPTGFGRGYNFI